MCVQKTFDETLKDDTFTNNQMLYSCSYLTVFMFSSLINNITAGN